VCTFAQGKIPQPAQMVCGRRLLNEVNRYTVQVGDTACSARLACSFPIDLQEKGVAPKCKGSQPVFDFNSVKGVNE
jgi:hypothetical protein